jgi:hypothetical protein
MTSVLVLLIKSKSKLRGGRVGKQNQDLESAKRLRSWEKAEKLREQVFA